MNNNNVTLPPHNIEAEQAVLCAMHDPDTVLEILSQTSLKADDFYLARNGRLFTAIQSVWEKFKTVDYLLVEDEVKCLGLDWDFSELIELRTPTYMHWPSQVDLIIHYAVRRAIIDAGTKGVQAAYDLEKPLPEVVATMESGVFGASRDRSKRGPSPIDMDEFYEQVESAPEEGLTGYETGLIDLDKLIVGLFPADLCIVAGRPGMMKTALGVSIAVNGLKKDKSVLFCTMEMPKSQMRARFLSLASGVNGQLFRRMIFTDDEYAKIVGISPMVRGWKNTLQIDDTPALSIPELGSKARRHQAEYGLDLLIVDYLQLMRSGDKYIDMDETRKVSYTSRSLKELAMSLNIPILAMAQLNRDCEKRNDKRPMQSDLKSSGSIEQDADTVIFIYRDEVYNPDTETPNIAELLVAKSRHGPTGRTNAFVSKPTGKFSNCESRKTNLNGDPNNWYKDPATNGNGNGHQNGKKQLVADIPFG